MLSRSALRLSLAGRAGAARWYSAGAQALGKDFIAQREAVRHHAADTTQLWRRISFFVCFPATITCIAWVRNVENEHEEHLEHIKEENGGELPEVPEYPYLNRRSKPFPWGPNSLFFNPHVNKDLSEA
ncbi:mitochondrial cytochrome c oxidase subunit VIa [Sistotremastrum niveocremeum HHB9708]|uniref:Mitochondrial cytochrome c oxidase subunit VIa n=2 Tax=Sistotremastraceae TaxID=3402574 RepID=A0A164UC96_9AGAM|nr:mitochondrial cytochrome c oxidase subunit VIa [Sistotremastrum niveocremeum HHB9708]KZT40081.1 mitochondrial cytochrome c oxidase subunit VIa [Sistotremastrum suecicum HHB10207 ss-3]